MESKDKRDMAEAKLGSTEASYRKAQHGLKCILWTVISMGFEEWFVKRTENDKVHLASSK